jgi:putative addiction module component (TIGR02574 family)
MSSHLTKDPLELSVAERIQLGEDLWESVLAKPEELELTDAQKAELDRRLDRLDKEGLRGKPWDEVRRRIFGDE